MTELPKNYDAAAVEAEIAAVWEAGRCFHAEPTDPGEPYCIVIPPPNVTAALHLGHALNNTIQDILVRQKRMAGRNAVWIPGTDHAGIATQTVVEKRVQREEGRRRTDFPREEFIGKIQAWKDEYEQVILGQLKSMGASCDFERTAFTMDAPRAKAVREGFFRLFQDGLIYRGKRLVNWDPVTQTALADDEVENKEIAGFFYYLKYPLVRAATVKERSADGAHEDRSLTVAAHTGAFVETGEYITVATTRPETMMGDTAIAINPTDPRAAALRGLFVKLPIIGRIIPIIEDDYVVKPIEFGGDPADTKAQMATGFLKVTPAHDQNDYEIGRRHDLPVINVMALDASISDQFGWTDGIGEAGFLLGLSREKARAAVIDWFKQNNLLEAVKPYTHSVGHSYRSHAAIEPYMSDQWYLEVTDDRLAGAALRAMDSEQRSSFLPLPPGEGRSERDQNADTYSATDTSPRFGAPSPRPSPGGRGGRNDALRFYPARYAKTFQSWHENIRDWCISRQLWWGHRIPVWKFADNDAIDSKTDEQLHTLIEQVIRLRRDGRIALRHTGLDDNAQSIDLQHSFICVREEDDKPALALLELLGFVQDEDVLDTWFSSALWPMSTLGWAGGMVAETTTPDALSVWNPTSVLCTAREIITLWVSRMVMFNEYFLGRLPFKDVFIHAMIQDGFGQKMSKSLGNGVDPLDIIVQHGTDALRFTLCNMTTQTQDVRLPVDCIDPHSGETFTPATLTNAAGYVVAKPVQEHKGKKIVSTYGQISGEATPTAAMPVARNTSSKFDYGKGFCNKLWSIARFVFNAIEGTGGAPIDINPSLADRWIISRLHRTAAEVTAALAAYRFDLYAKSVYDFVENDLSGWYVEFAKPQLRDEAQKPQTAAVLAGVIDHTLRLLHPVVPFITEKLWATLNEIRPERGVAGYITCPPSTHAIKAMWPESGATEDAIEAAFARVQELVTAIRNLRNEQKVEPRRVITIALRTPEDFVTLKPALEVLTIAKMTFLSSTDVAPSPSTTLRVGGCELFVADLVDEAAEKERGAKRTTELLKQEAALVGRMSNEAYMAKAPPQLVKQTTDQLAAVRAELEKLK